MAGRAERLGRAALENYSTNPLFNTKAVVRQTGVPAPTLRAWERRYGILRPHRGENDYRLYSERDIAVIRWLREEVESGLTISQAIALLRSLASPAFTGAAAPAAPGNVLGPAPFQGPTEEQQSAGQRTSAAAGTPAALTPQGNRLTELTESFLEAVMHLDETDASRLLACAFALFTVEQVIEGMIEPALGEIGERWAQGKATITTEHFASALLRAQLEALYRSEPLPDAGPLILVGCAPGELHELGALVLALLLRRLRSGLRVVYLGQSVEPGQLLETIQAQRPAVVCLSACLAEHRQGIADLSRRLETLPAIQRPSLVFGGQAFRHEPANPAEIAGILLNSRASQASFKIQQLCNSMPL
jgi:DNA-binding transcriptional MerR regulator